MKKIGEEGWILAVTIVMFLAFILWLMTACSATEVRDTKMLWHASKDGDCVLFIEGLSAETGKDLSDNWKMQDCNINLIEEDKE